MTVIIGVLCTDGVVIGSDSAATFTAGPTRTVEQPVTKMFVVGEGEAIVAGTGAVGLGQRFTDVVDRISPKNDFRGNSALVNGKNISIAAINDFTSTKAPPGHFGALVAFASRGGCHLCEFGAADFQPELKTPEMWFVSMGCGQPLADPFLGLLRRVFFNGKQPSRSEGIFTALWALRHAIELNTGGILGPPKIGVLDYDPTTKKGQARIIPDTELQEHQNNIEEAEKYLAQYRDTINGCGQTATITAPPTPPNSRSD